MPRLLFTKTGDAVWISHLDTMRLFQRGFQRAGLPLTHTQGFNPRPSVSIALPLSVGVESLCELLDFDLVDETIGCEEILARLNPVLVKGIQVLSCYNTGKKLKQLRFLQAKITLEYDSGIPENAIHSLQALFHRESLEVEKRSKNGPIHQNIIPMIRSMQLRALDANTIELDTIICCQEPSLNPTQLVAAIELYCPALRPDFYRCQRAELFDENLVIFR